MDCQHIWREFPKNHQGNFHTHLLFICDGVRCRIMRIPITKYGLPQVAVYPAILACVMMVYVGLIWYFFPEKIRTTGLWAMLCVWLPEVLLLITAIWVVSFFRDPHRQIPNDAKALLSPADGTISDIELVENDPAFPQQAIRIGIFLSIFNVHINRAPCAVRVGSIQYRPGQFKNALDPNSARVNESNDIQMFRLDAPRDELMVRQISGAIARRIVCDLKTGDQLTAGQQFGMLKFGSRTELYLPARDNAHCAVKIGDKVKAGQTILVRYQ